MSLPAPSVPGPDPRDAVPARRAAPAPADAVPGTPTPKLLRPGQGPGPAQPGECAGRRGRQKGRARGFSESQDRSCRGQARGWGRSGARTRRPRSCCTEGVVTARPPHDSRRPLQPRQRTPRLSSPPSPAAGSWKRFRPETERQNAVVRAGGLAGRVPRGRALPLADSGCERARGAARRQASKPRGGVPGEGSLPSACRSASVPQFPRVVGLQSPPRGRGFVLEGKGT